jgi:N-formylglutamate amidohydrolase
MEMAAPFTLYHTDTLRTPVLVSVPHAGRDYPPELLRNLRVSPPELLRLEDRYADRLVQPAIAAGCSAIVAHRARAWLDLNRAEHDIDSGMFTGIIGNENVVQSSKARGGLGLFPRRLQACGELWKQPMVWADGQQRINDVHRPYHQSIADVLAAMRAKFGVAILLDVHSMPPLPLVAATQPMPRIVVGDRFGRSAATVYAELILGRATQTGLAAALNAPYSGDYILHRHGDPARGIHAVQLEIDRSLYLDAELREPSDGLKTAAQLVQCVVSDLIDKGLAQSFVEAAE